MIPTLMSSQEGLTCEAVAGGDRTDLERRNVTEAFCSSATQCQECRLWSSLEGWMLVMAVIMMEDDMQSGDCSILI